MSLPKRILKFYQKHPHEWISGGAIERLVAEKTTYKASNASRRLRELREDNLLESKEMKGTVFYRYVPQRKEINDTLLLHVHVKNLPQPKKVTEIRVVDNVAYQTTKTVMV
jgi:DNA-binding transcriptional ArsR family regulator